MIFEEMYTLLAAKQLLIKIIFRYHDIVFKLEKNGNKILWPMLVKSEGMRMVECFVNCSLSGEQSGPCDKTYKIKGENFFLFFSNHHHMPSSEHDFWHKLGNK